MRFDDYKENVKRTLPDLGTPLLNSIHMTLGMGSELEELLSAIIDNDKVNIGEELTDIAWYACNFANLWDIKLNPIVYITTMQSEPSEDQLNRLVHDMVRAISKLQDYDKKELAYGKQPGLENRGAKVQALLIFLGEAYQAAGLNAEVCMEANIAKLKQRYPDKFDSNKAINRDTDIERTILDSHGTGQ